MQKMSQSNYTSPEIFAAVFGPNVSAAEVVAEAVEAGYTPQDWIMTSIVEARKQGLEAEEAEAYSAICEECRIPG